MPDTTHEPALIAGTAQVHGGSLKSVVAGLVGGLAALSATISYPAILFTGELERYLGAGIGLALFSTTVLAPLIGWRSGQPGVIANAQIEPIVVLGIMASSMMVALGPAASDQVVLGTLLLLIVLSSLSFGLVLYLLGVRRRGNLVRYVPFPVIGGFFLYIAWLLLQGGLSSMIGQRLSPANASLLLDPALWLHWLPGLLAAAALFALQLTRRHYLNVPLFLVGAVALFWLVAWAAGIPLAALQAGGYVLSTHADHATWSPAWLLEALAHADWRVALHEAPQLVVLWLICMVTLLLSASSVEVATRSDVDLNQELKVTGIANMLYGLGGGPPATSRRAPAFCRTTWAPGPGWSG